MKPKKVSPKKPANFTAHSADTLSARVYSELKKVPKGQVITYKELARKVGKPNAIRRVATIVGQNAMPIIIPCHRVIRSDGQVGEYTYKGKRNQAKKIALLKSEGIKFSGTKVLR